jgi:hypothetical protein
MITGVAVGCGGSAAAPPTTTVRPSAHPLEGLAAAGTIVAPAFAVSVNTQLSGSIGDSRLLLRELDSAIASALLERGLQHGWILPRDLAVSYRHNPTYATDPYGLAEEPLRTAGFTTGSRLTEPLASQLRTMIALHDGARLVMLPIQLTLEPAVGAANSARASLKVAVVDPRFSEAIWVGVVRGDSTSTDPHALTRAVAEHLADLIVSR